MAFKRVEHADYAEGGRGWDEATPAILPLFQARAGLQLALKLGVPNVRDRMRPVLAALREKLPNAFQPADPEAWGQYVLVPHLRADEVCKWLRAERRIAVDARQGFIRFGPDFLTTEDEIEAAGTALSQSPL